MAGDAVDNTPEQVAWRMLLTIARLEKKMDRAGNLEDVDRQWVLSTYAECLRVTTGAPDLPTKIELVAAEKDS